MTIRTRAELDEALRRVFVEALADEPFDDDGDEAPASSRQLTLDPARPRPARRRVEASRELEGTRR